MPLLPLIAVSHICEAICKPSGITPPIFSRRVDWFRQNRAFNIDKAKREISYRPRVGLAEGLRRTAEWYQQNVYMTANSIRACGWSRPNALRSEHDREHGRA